MFKRIIKTVIVATLFCSPALAEEKVDLDMMNKIRAEGFYNSEVSDILAYLADNIGQRLSGSPGMTRANQWTMEKLKEWDMKNVHLHGFEFGRGWTYEHVAVHMTSPRNVQILAYPVSWFPGTDGLVEGEVMRVTIKKEEDFEQYKGKLKGKILALSKPAKIKQPSNKVFSRHNDESLQKQMIYPVPSKNISRKKNAVEKLKKRLKKRAFKHKIYQFFKDEGALATVRTSKRTGGLFDASGYNYQVGNTPAIAQVLMETEAYNRMLRLIKKKEDVRLSIDVKATFYDEDTKNYSTIAEIPGKGRNPEIVMAGAHLDSWHLGDGAVDNGAGVAIVMEAVRILKALNVKPKRTIRIALWGAEEQGLLGSKSYVQEHFAAYPKVEDEELNALPEWLRLDSNKPLMLKRNYEKFSVYFNLDNGHGKIRGIKTHGNVASQAIFNKWFKPFNDLGAVTSSTKAAGGTDHVVFQGTGLPGYQFIQDNLDYFSRLHHTQLDVLDNVNIPDLKQASVIMAAFLYNAAMREDRMPRRPYMKDTAKAK